MTLSFTNTRDISYLGGITAYNFGTIIKCSNYQVLDFKTNYCVYVGGITGFNGTDNVIENCYNVSYIVGQDTSASYGSKVGGIAGGNYGSIKYCYNSASVSGGSNDWEGGIAANGTGSYLNCVWLYYSNCAEYGNEEVQNASGIKKVNSDAEVMNYCKQYYDSTIWDFTSRDHPVIK